MFDAEARLVIDWCRRLAAHTEVPGSITRRCLTDPMRLVHHDLMGWARRLGLSTRVDAAGNLRAVRAPSTSNAPTLYLGSHLDTVPDAGAFDGILGVVWALALVEALGDRPLPIRIEVLGFSDEEGVRFRTPFIGSRALAGTCDDALLECIDEAGVTVRQALITFGSDPAGLPEAAAVPDAIGYLECHIEQGPILAHLGHSLGVVEHIVGQTRVDVVFHGQARHAGTTPMALRRDAVAAAAEWIGQVERIAAATADAVATVGRISATPGAGNVIAATCDLSLDVRHHADAVRHTLVSQLRTEADVVALRRGLTVDWRVRLEQAAVSMDARLTRVLAAAVDSCGYPVTRMTSGAGHDAMVLAPRMPVTMLFVRSPGGISHHPDEAVRVEDVAAALAVGRAFVMSIAESAHV